MTTTCKTAPHTGLPGRRRSLLRLAGGSLAGGLLRRSAVRLMVAAPAAGIAAALAGCDSAGKPVFKNADITGADYAHDFKLTGHDGKTYTLADFRGKVVVVFFGFTQCPDVCPTNLMELNEAKAKLGAAGDKLQVLFITIDPARDTQAVLAQYVPAFNPTFLGLYGDDATTAATAKAFKVFYQKVPGKTPDSYTMEHTAGSYVFDAQGKVRLFVRHGQGVDALVGDLKQLLDQAG